MIWKMRPIASDGLRKCAVQRSGLDKTTDPFMGLASYSMHAIKNIIWPIALSNL